MIEYISGKIAELTPTYAVLETNGVGYMASISLNTYTALEGVETGKLYIHEAIREDAYQLYGFATRDEREVFRMLTQVSGVGAASARTIVSAMSAAELQSTIASEDVRSLKSIKGIGQKTAERIVVELKEKMAKMDLGALPGAAPAAPANANQAVREEALAALSVLGYTNRAQAQKVVDKLLADDPDSKVEKIVKTALHML